MLCCKKSILNLKNLKGDENLRYLLAGVLFFSFLYARINPFVPVIVPGENNITKPVYFKKAVVYLPNDARILKKIIFVYQSDSSDIRQKIINIDKNIDFHAPIIITHHPKQGPMKTFYLGVFKLFIKHKKVFIQTKAPLIRAFFLVAPYRLVLDFRQKSNFNTINKKTGTFLKKVTVGSHGYFYRAVLYLDSNYRYKIKKTEEGIEIEFY